MRRSLLELLLLLVVVRVPASVVVETSAGGAVEQVEAEAAEAEQLLREGELAEGAHAVASIAVGRSPDASLEWSSQEVGARFERASALLETWWTRLPKKARKKRAKVLRTRAAGGETGRATALPHSAERHQQLAVAVVGSALLAYMERRLAAPFDTELDLVLCTAGTRLAHAAQEGWTEDTLAATRVIGSALLFCPAETTSAIAVLRHGLSLVKARDEDETLALHCALINALDSQAVVSSDATAAAVTAVELAVAAYPTDIDIRRLQVATAVGRFKARGVKCNLTATAAIFRAALSRFPRDPVRQDGQGPCLSSTCHPQHDIAVSYAARRWQARALSGSNSTAIEYGRARHRGGWGWREPLLPSSSPPPPPPRCTIARVHHSELTPARFRKEYANRNLPVMIVGAADPTAAATRSGGGDGSALASAWAAWSKQGLIDSRGDDVLLVRPSSGIVAAALSVDPWKPGAAVNVTLRDFVATWSATPTVGRTQRQGEKNTAKRQLNAMGNDSSDPPYHFKNPSTGVGEQWLLADAELPWFSPSDGGRPVFSHGEQLRRERALWFLGPPGSGPFFHVHPAAYNALIYGERRWFVYPPHGLQRPPSVPMPQWAAAFDARRAAAPGCASSAETGGLCGVADDTGKPELQWDLGWESISECTQEGGDVLFIPSGWHHAVLNTQESVGIAVELGDNVQLVDAVLAADDAELRAEREPRSKGEAATADSGD